MATENKLPVSGEPKKELPETPKADPPKTDWTKPVPVALVRFDRALQYPGKQSEQHAKTEQEPAKGPPTRSWQVEFIAAIRQFRITFTDHAKGAAPKIGYVPECRVLTWEPLA